MIVNQTFVQTDPRMWSLPCRLLSLRICQLDRVQNSYWVSKRGCVFPMVNWPAFRMGQYRVNENPYHAPQFINYNMEFKWDRLPNPFLEWEYKNKLLLAVHNYRNDCKRCIQDFFEFSDNHILAMSSSPSKVQDEIFLFRIEKVIVSGP